MIVVHLIMLVVSLFGLINLKFKFVDVKKEFKVNNVVFTVYLLIQLFVSVKW